MELNLIVLLFEGPQMKLSTFRVYLAMYTIACGVSNVSAMQLNSKEKDVQNAAIARLGDAGLMPHMGSIPTSGTLRSSGDRMYCDHMCIPSSPARCTGGCYAPAAQQAQKASSCIKKLDVPQECGEREEDIRKFKDLMKKIVQRMGKSEAVKIAKIALAESSDSDTDSTESLNSPGDTSDDILEELKEKKK